MHRGYIYAKIPHLRSFYKYLYPEIFRCPNKLWSKPDGFYKWQFKNFCEANKNNKYEILSAETTIDNDEATVYVNVTTEEGTEKHFAELSRRDEKWYVDYMNF